MRLRRFRNQHKAGGAGVEPVAEHGRPIAPRLKGALAVEIQRHAVDERVGGAACLVGYRDPGGLVHGEHGAILVDDAQFWPRREERRAIRRAEHRVRQIDAHCAALREPRRERLLFAVHFDLIFAQVFVQAARGKRASSAASKRGRVVSVTTNSRIRALLPAFYAMFHAMACECAIPNGGGKAFGFPIKVMYFFLSHV